MEIYRYKVEELEGYDEFFVQITDYIKEQIETFFEEKESEFPPISDDWAMFSKKHLILIAKRKLYSEIEEWMIYLRYRLAQEEEKRCKNDERNERRKEARNEARRSISSDRS
jgi:hypothetical protein